MCIDSLLLKFNEKQFTQLFISVFASDCTNGGRPPMVVGGPCGAGIRMTINLPGHPMSVTQCYLAMNDTHVIWVVYSFASFPSYWMLCLCVDPRPPHCLWLFMCSYSGQQCCV